MRVSAGSAVKYATLPGIFPRLKDLLFTGFGPVTQLIALICFMVGLLPKNHPCFAKDTRATYGLRKILAAAAHNVKFEWRYLDKIIIFTVIVCGTVMMMLYLVGLVAFVILSPAFALGLGQMFTTAAPTNDIAFMMLDRVFGIPGVYNSVVASTAPFPNPFQIALHELFRFFSMGIFFIALALFLYYIVEIVFDITQTGHVSDHLSDGDEGSKGFTWLPIRFVVAFGLLLPFGDGLNSAQWITLYAAKYGSGLATNAWINYNTQTGDNPLGEQNVNLVSKPKPLDTAGLIKSLILMRSCIEMNYWEYGDSAGSHFVRGMIVNGNQSKALFRTMTERSRYVAMTSSNYFMDDQKSYNADPSAIANGQAGDNFIDILKYSGMGDITLVLGEIDEANPDKYKNFPGGVLPVCGEIVIPVTGLTGEALFAAEGYLFGVMNILFEVNRPGVDLTTFEDNLYIAVLREYNRSSSLMKDFLTRRRTSGNPDCWYDDDNDDYDSLDETNDSGEYLGKCLDPVPAKYWEDLLVGFFGYAFETPPVAAYDFLAGTSDATTGYGAYSIGPTAFDSVGKPNPFLIGTGILQYGWGGAGLWYNKIAERNGSLYTAATTLPKIKAFPRVMEQIKAARKGTDTGLGNNVCESFNPRKGGQTTVAMPGEKDQFVAEEALALHSLCEQLYNTEGIEVQGVSRTTQSNNPFVGAIQAFFSEMKSFDIQDNYEVTPMVQLASIGRMMVDKAIGGVVASTATAALGGAAHIADSGAGGVSAKLGEALGAASSSIMSIAVLGLTGGVILHYVLPFMPFVYFFFAVGRWVKVIFEAMVGMPLWALAHMHKGGPGLPGSNAATGYFLILEIFIRPVVTVFSLVGAFALFSALASGLNSVFSLISTNLFGAATTAASVVNATASNTNFIELARGTVDQFFLTIFYVILTYMIGVGCFKLIDLIPDNIMRWSGMGAQSFGAADISDDLIEKFEWELPMRVEGMLDELGSIPGKVLYEPFAKPNLEKIKKNQEAEAAHKAAEKEAEKNKMRESMRNQQGDPS